MKTLSRLFLIFYITIQMLFFNILFADGTNITPEGSEEPIFFDKPPRIHISDSMIEVETSIAKYDVYVNSNRILCWQKVDTLRHNLTVHFIEEKLLDGIIFKEQESTKGYSILENKYIRIAFHSDGTMWVHVKSEGKQINFVSEIPRSWDKGGGLLEKGVTYFPESERVLRTNWLVITDSNTDDIETTGGFGIFARPLEGRDHDGNPAYFPYMQRNKDNPDITSLLTERPEYTGGSSFIVSVFPAKRRNPDIIAKRLQFIFPSFYQPAQDKRLYPYSFPSKEELRAWVDSSWQPYREDGGSGYHYWSPIDSTPLPVTTIVLFEDIWTRATEFHSKKPDYVKYRDPAFIPYVTPEHIKGLNGTTEEELNQFLALMDTPAFAEIEVLLYISACSDYFQIPYPLTEQEYYKMFMDQVKKLIYKYPRINGFFIDTLPMNGDPVNLEPMILSYRIMRDIRRLKKNMLIVLHNSENPIGTKRLHFDWDSKSLPGKRVNPARLVQIDIYAPFIDRYADILLHGEGYPIDIEFDSDGKLKDYISKHIKYVVDPIGKSNSMGMLKWTNTGRPFVQPGEEYKKSYFDLTYPVCIGKSRQAEWYYFRPSQSNEEEERINRLLIMDKIFDSYIKRGHLIMRSMAPQNTKGQYDKRMRYALPGPLEDKPPTNYRNFFGPNKDYMRPVSLGWYYSKQIASEMDK